MTWEEIQQLVPTLPRGWYELSQFPQEDRIEFTRGFWLSKLPISGSRLEIEEQKIEEFFDSLESIEVFATQVKAPFPYETHMLYTLKNGLGYFQGGPPVPPHQFEAVKKQFAQFPLPNDYLAFLEIHDGFSKYTDTGMIRAQELARTYRKLQEILDGEDLIRPDGEVIDSMKLIPFYESYGLHSYQCFYAEWFPENEMGNVFFSTFDYSVSNFLDKERLYANLAFPSFVSWLGFYLEDLV